MTHITRLALLTLYAGAIALPVGIAAAADAWHGFRPAAQTSVCSTSARLKRHACSFETAGDFYTERAKCLDEAGRFDRRRCKIDAREERYEGRQLCGEQYQARREVCDLVGEGRYDPDFEPDNFVDPNDIGTSVTPNPYLPLVVGNTWKYRSGDETVVVRVLDRTKLIEGVTCRVVNDVVRDDGDLVEDTDDWFAQDKEGNVWYCGEEVKDYEYFEGDAPRRPELVDIDGTFKVGRDGARAGILVLADPAVGDVYRQEYLLGEAEDVVEVVSTTSSESAPGGACNGDCLVTRDFTPLDPEANENKFYAPGLGLILETDLNSGERLELIEFTPG